MSDMHSTAASADHLKQKLLEALQNNPHPSYPAQDSAHMPFDLEPDMDSMLHEEGALVLDPSSYMLEGGGSVYGMLMEQESEAPLPEELLQSQARLRAELRHAQQVAHADEVKMDEISEFNGTLSMRGVVPTVETETETPAGNPPSSLQANSFNMESVISGGSMADLSGYKDLSKAPVSFGDEDLNVSSFGGGEPVYGAAPTLASPQLFVQETAGNAQELDSEFTGNVKTLIRLVNELPEGVTKQTGAQIIRLTMEAMGISMEDVLSEAQAAQSEMLDAVRANIKKIEEYKTVIRKLETDIKYYQGRANELSEIIDLFILSNTSSQKTPGSDD